LLAFVATGSFRLERLKTKAFVAFLTPEYDAAAAAMKEGITT